MNQEKSFPWGNETDLKTAKQYVVRRLSVAESDIGATIAFLSSEMLYESISRSSQKLMHEACRTLLEEQLVCDAPDVCILKRLLEVVEGALDDKFAEIIHRWAYNEGRPSEQYLRLQRTCPEAGLEVSGFLQKFAGCGLTN